MKMIITQKKWKKDSILIFVLFGLVFLLGISFVDISDNGKYLEIQPLKNPFSAAEPLTWNKTYGEGQEKGKDLWINETDIFILGETQTWGSGSVDVLLARFDIDGNLIWNVTWGDSSSNYAGSLWGDNSALYGTSGNNLIKWASNGTNLWNKTLTSTLIGLWIDEIYVYGLCSNKSLVKMWKFNGTTVSTTLLPGDGTVTYTCMTGDETNLYIGSYTAQAGSGYDFALEILLKLAKNGSLLWQETLDTYGGHNFLKSIWVENGYIYTGGNGDDFTGGTEFIMVAKYDATGSRLWSKTISETGVSHCDIWADNRSIYAYYYQGGIAKLMKWNNGWNLRWSEPENIYRQTNCDVNVRLFGLLSGNIISMKSNTNISIAKWNTFNMGQSEPTVLLGIDPSISTSGNIQINWEKLPTIDYYHIYRSNEPITSIWGLSRIKMHATENYTDTGLTYGTYYYVVTAVNNYGESNISNCVSVQVDTLPTVNIGTNSSSIIEGQSVLFSITGSKGDPPTTYQWDFGDGSVNSTIENPIYAYLLAGQYLAKLTASDANGNVSIASASITVGDNRPVANFTQTATAIIGNNSITFQFSGSLGNAPTSLQWNFGDGSINSTASNPTHLFTKAGVFPIVLTLNDSDGDISVYRSQVTIMADLKPTALFNVSGTIVEPGSTVKFTWIGAKGNDPLTYQWDFGDKSLNSTQQNPSHLYSAAGVYVARLTVIDANGDSSIAEIKITVQFKKETDTGLFDTSGTAVIVGVAGAAALIGAAIGVAKKRR
jgi:PKD repeat protein